MDNIVAIVLSAGRGSRMNSDIPKQYMNLHEKPVIFYSLKAFEDSPVSSIVLVAGADDVEYCKKEIVDKYHLTKVRAVVAGGKERYESVKNGLDAAGSCDYVMIHDGARPLLSQELIARCIETVKKENTCVAAVPVKDTIKTVDNFLYTKETPERRSLWAMQTPQCFSSSILKESYEKLLSDEKNRGGVPMITDDAMVVEYATGKGVKLVEGDYHNIKITTPEDMLIAEAFMGPLTHSEKS